MKQIIMSLLMESVPKTMRLKEPTSVGECRRFGSFLTLGSVAVGIEGRGVSKSLRVCYSSSIRSTLRTRKRDKRRSDELLRRNDDSKVCDLSFAMAGREQARLLCPSSFPFCGHFRGNAWFDEDMGGGASSLFEDTQEYHGCQEACGGSYHTQDMRDPFKGCCFRAPWSHTHLSLYRAFWGSVSHVLVCVSVWVNKWKVLKRVFCQKKNNNKLVRKVMKSCANVIVLEEREDKQWENTWGTAGWIMAREHTRLKLTRAGILGLLQPVRCHFDSSSSLFTSDFLGEKKWSHLRGGIRQTATPRDAWRHHLPAGAADLDPGERSHPLLVTDGSLPPPPSGAGVFLRFIDSRWPRYIIHNRRAMNRLIHEIVVMRRISSGREKHMYWCSGKVQATAKFASRIRWRIRRAP